MKNIFSTLTLFCFLLILCSSSCKKHKHIKPVDQLPPATQEGKNTFGCYVNGKLFLPKGQRPGAIPNLSATIDPYWHDGAFGITAYNTKWKKNIEFLAISIGGDSIKGIGTYTMGFNKRIIGTYSIVSDTSYCPSFTNDEPQSSSYLKITRYDYENGIVSGEFEFTIIGSDCMDTIKVTQGRFDYQFQ